MIIHEHERKHILKSIESTNPWKHWILRGFKNMPGTGLEPVTRGFSVRNQPSNSNTPSR